MTTGERLKELISDSDKKQYAIAQDLRVTPSTFSKYVTGASVLPGDVAARAAVYFGVTEDYLLGLTDVRPFAVSEHERAFLSHFRTLSKEQKELIVQNISLMRAQNER